MRLSNSFATVEYLSVRGYATMTIGFRVMCSSNSYGSDCGTICEERDDALGHYTCSSTGERVCMTGYQDAATNCTNCIPATGCCEWDDLVLIPACVGISREKVLKKKICWNTYNYEFIVLCYFVSWLYFIAAPTNGFCISPGECLCRFGYNETTLCQTTINQSTCHGQNTVSNVQSWSLNNNHLLLCNLHISIYLSIYIYIY